MRRCRLFITRQQDLKCWALAGRASETDRATVAAEPGGSVTWARVGTLGSARQAVNLPHWP